MRQKYYVCMDYGLDETGKRVKKYKTYPTLAQARRGLRDFQTEQDTHQTVAPRSMTLDQWLEYWMEEVIQPNRAATTIYGYRKIIDNHLSDALGSVPIQKLTPQHLQQYYSMLMRDKGLSANTVRRHHDLLSCALHMALRQDIILRCPTERVEPPRVIPHEARFYTPAELKRLFGLVEGHWLELIVKLAGSLGLRREEICGLRWSSVDFELRKLHIKEARTAAGAELVQKETKNRSSNRILHMSDDLYRLLRRERARQAERRLALGDAWPDTGMVAVDAKGPLLPQRCVPGLHPLHSGPPPAQNHPSRPAPHLRHRGLRPGRAPVRHRQGSGPLHPRHHGQDLHPPAGSEPHRHPGPGGKCAEIMPGARTFFVRAPGAFPQKMVQSMQSSALLRCV